MPESLTKGAVAPRPGQPVFQRGFPHVTPRYLVFYRGFLIGQSVSENVAATLAAENRGAVVFKRVNISSGDDE